MLSFEIKTGGFDWFGSPPAKPMLSAYGLHEWVDIAAVRGVGADVVERTARYLASIQKEDGSFPDAFMPHSWQGTVSGSTAPTAYVTWALARSGREGDAIRRGIAWLRGRIAAEDDPYVLTLCAAALLEADPSDADGAAVAKRLAERASSGPGGTLRLRAEKGTALHGRGDSAGVEATALGGLVAERLARPQTLAAGPLLDALVSDRGADGTWGTTQATILALRALLGVDPVRSNGETTLVVRPKDGAARRLVIADRDRDLTSTIDLSDALAARTPLDIEAFLAGTGRIRAALVLEYAVPFETPARPATSLAFSASWERTDLEAGKPANIALRLAAAGNEPVAIPLIVVPMPAGFRADAQGLATLRRATGVERVEADARSVVVYLRELVPGKPLEATLALVPRLSGRVVAPPAFAYAYYEPEAKAYAPARTLTVR